MLIHIVIKEEKVMRNYITRLPMSALIAVFAFTFLNIGTGNAAYASTSKAKVKTSSTQTFMLARHSPVVKVLVTKTNGKYVPQNQWTAKGGKTAYCADINKIPENKYGEYIRQVAVSEQAWSKASI